MNCRLFVSSVLYLKFDNTVTVCLQA